MWQWAESLKTGANDTPQIAQLRSLKLALESRIERLSRKLAVRKPSALSFAMLYQETHRFLRNMADVKKVPALAVSLADWHKPGDKPAQSERERERLVQEQRVWQDNARHFIDRLSRDFAEYP